MTRRLPIDPSKPNEFTLDGTYQRKLRGIQGRPSFRVTQEPRRQRLSAVTQRDAQLEGFGGRRPLERFKLDWLRRYDPWCRRHRTASDTDVLKRWELHADTECWVLEFDLLDDGGRTRFLASQHGRALFGDGQYTNRAQDSIDRLPVIDPSPEHVRQARAEGERLRAERRAEASAVEAQARADRGRLQRQRFSL